MALAKELNLMIFKNKYVGKNSKVKLVEESQLASFLILFTSLMNVMMYKVGSHFLGVSFILMFSDTPRGLILGGHKFPGLRRIADCWAFISLFQDVLRISWNSFGYPFIVAL